MGREGNEFRATITNDGQITLPVDIRELWKLKPGDQIGFSQSDSSEVTIRPIRRRSIFESMLDLPPLSLGRPLLQSDIDDSVAAEMIEQEARSRGTPQP